MQADRDDPGASVVAVMVVEDQASFGDAISVALETRSDIRCVANVATAEDAVAHARATCPDVVLLDVALPGASGIDIIPDLRDACPDVRVIVLTANTSGQMLLDAVEAGADAFLPKEHRFSDIIDTIRDDASASADPRAMASVLHRARHLGDPEVDGLSEELTEREYQILLLLADGDSVKEIARRLGISVHTCRGHVRALLVKLDAHSQLAAVVHAARAGLLPNLRAGGG
ncbi:MAG: response regulator transcription factor [Actinomycetota bacterium]|nr:response regulator transcription factor [Actinomycetota bacterium]